MDTHIKVDRTVSVVVGKVKSFLLAWCNLVLT